MVGDDAQRYAAHDIRNRSDSPGDGGLLED
jgi:hypothetical protein